MTPLQAFQKMRELCEEYHLKFANVKPQTVEGYPIGNIEQALKDLEWLISKVDVDFFNRLSDPEDKIRFLRIVGYEIKYKSEEFKNE